jgi:thiol-disulfide isomerase/thioredoxin
MKRLLIAALILASMTATAQKTFTVVQDAQLHEPVYNGLVTFDDLDREPAFDWLKKGGAAYQPDGKKIDYLRAMLPQYAMVVFLGTWCGDSKNLIPKFEKVLLLTGYPQHKLTMYCVDMEKRTTHGEQKKYDITNVPTFILYKNGKEAGRVTESVHTSIEADLSAIIAKDSGKAMKQ